MLAPAALGNVPGLQHGEHGRGGQVWIGLRRSAQAERAVLRLQGPPKGRPGSRGAAPRDRDAATAGPPERGAPVRGERGRQLRLPAHGAVPRGRPVHASVRGAASGGARRPGLCRADVRRAGVLPLPRRGAQGCEARELPPGGRGRELHDLEAGGLWHRHASQAAQAHAASADAGHRRRQRHAEGQRAVHGPRALREPVELPGAGRGWADQAAGRRRSLELWRGDLRHALWQPALRRRPQLDPPGPPAGLYRGGLERRVRGRRRPHHQANESRHPRAVDRGAGPEPWVDPQLADGGACPAAGPLWH
mmetsp:Transcript_32020/g.84038  ORF Transcript_32020/g.84038 Transcript_32020/m.84038 type:complete len:306 (+) Transcript_32020:480-1397(+)